MQLDRSSGSWTRYCWRFVKQEDQPSPLVLVVRHSQAPTPSLLISGSKKRQPRTSEIGCNREQLQWRGGRRSDATTSVPRRRAWVGAD
jgi:hypothetical protein